MADLPPELLDGIVEHLSEDVATLKALRLSARRFNNSTVKYLYKDVVLYNTDASWHKFDAVLTHQEYSKYVKTIESSSRYDETCWSQHLMGCYHNSCISTMGYLNHIPRHHGVQGDITLKLYGLRHLIGRKLENVDMLGNISKLELDTSLPVGQDCGKAYDIEDVIAHWVRAFQGGRVRHLSLIGSKTLYGYGGKWYNPDIVWLLAWTGWSNLETVSLTHTKIVHPSLMFFIRGQTGTLTTLHIIEPVTETFTKKWLRTRSWLTEIAPEHFEYTNRSESMFLRAFANSGLRSRRD